MRQIRDGAPSPGGGRIAFTALDRLWVVDADGGSPRRLTGDERSEHFPAWSPDGAGSEVAGAKRTPSWHRPSSPPASVQPQAE